MKQNRIMRISTIAYMSITFSLLGCGGSTSTTTENTTPATTENTTPTTTENTTPTEDKKVQFPWENGQLKVSKKRLMHDNGADFFWMADTAWELYTKTNEDIDLYLDNRAKKKFTVVQAVALHGYHTNFNEILPFTPQNTLDTPNEDFWTHMDYLIDAAAKRGLYVALAPAWHAALETKKIGDANKTGRISRTKDATKYGTWIAKRYKNKPNIIWMIGGDTALEGELNGVDKNTEIAIWDALGNAIDAVDSDSLITFHPLGKIPSIVFNRPKWLDFNMLQSGRETAVQSIDAIQDALKTPYPVVDAESVYENFALWRRGAENDRATAFQIRDNAYSEIFAGAFGYTYGHDSVYRFWEQDISNPKCSKDTWACSPNIKWKQALDSKGSQQMQYVSALMQSRPQNNRVPYQQLIQNEPKAQKGIIATKGEGYAMIYTAFGEPIVVNTRTISDTVKVWWYDPRTGVSTAISGFTPDSSGYSTFTPPTGVEKRSDSHLSNGIETDFVRNANDWVLVIDDTTKHFGIPGQ